jgi:hypothetical protein
MDLAQALKHIGKEFNVVFIYREAHPANSG